MGDQYGKISNKDHNTWHTLIITRPGCRIKFQLVLNAAYSCRSSIDCMHWPNSVSTPENAGQRLVFLKHLRFIVYATFGGAED